MGLGREQRWALVDLLAERDGGRFCRYCGRSLKPWQATLDHVRPIARRGARRDPANLVLACHACNQRKRDLSMEEAGMVLRGPDSACLREWGVKGGCGAPPDPSHPLG